MTQGRICIVDDDEAVRESLEALLLAAGFDVRVFGSAAEFRAGFEPASAGCVLLDVRMPGIDGLTLLESLGTSLHGVPVIMMTAHADVPMAARAMRAGAADFVEKPFEQAALLESIAAAMARSGPSAPEADAQLQACFTRLTPRETEVMRKMVEGLPNKLIAHALGMSPRTVEIHRGRVMQKTGARSLARLVRMAIRAGVVDDDEG